MSGQMTGRFLSILSFLLLVLELKAQSCPGDWIMSGDGKSCYSFMDDTVNFFSAEQACVSLGGHLTYIPNSGEDNIITQKATAHWSDNLLGIFYVGGMRTNGTWEWMDGSPFSYTAWTSGEPRPGRDCIGHYVGQRSWISVDCNQRLNYVCQFSFATTTPAPPTTPPSTPVPFTTPSPCSSANYVYNSFTGFCYHLLSNCVSYAFAYIECDLEGALLASIHSATENQQITQMFTGQAPTNGSCDPNVFWLGLAYDFGAWEWADETPVDYTNEDPANPLGGNYTTITPVVFNTSSVGSDGPYWYTSVETLKFYGVCKMPAVTRLPAKE